MSINPNIRRLGLQLLVAALFLVLFLAFIRSKNLNAVLLPSPAKFANSFAQNRGIHANNFATTTSLAAGGLLVAMALTALLAAAAAVEPEVGNVLRPFMIMLKATPVLAFAPFLSILLGTGPYCKITVAAILSFFPLIVGALDGLDQAPSSLQTMRVSWGAGRWRFFTTVSWPYALRGYATALKTAAPLAVVGAVVAEFVIGGNRSGLGTFILVASNQMMGANLLAGILGTTLLGLLFFGSAQLAQQQIERRLNLAK
jgi:ABC-type nitrate/sulfonate/bicarbonate transport system permease component